MSDVQVTNSERSSRVAVRRMRRRAEILTVAAIHFAKFGYEEASLEAIGAEVGLTRGSLYTYIESKEELLLRITIEATREIAEAGEAAGRQASRPDRQLYGQLVAHVESSCSDRSARLPHMYDRYILGRGEVRIAQQTLLHELRSIHKRYTDFTRAIVEVGREAGLFHVLDCRFTVDSILAGANQTGLWYMDASPTMSALDVAQQYARRAVGGLISPFQVPD